MGTDINGFEKAKTIGKDVFLMTFDLNTRELDFHKHSTSRENTLNECSTDANPQICGSLIFFDGWEIKDDYPWL